MTEAAGRLELVQLPVEAMDALIAGDLALASALSGAPLTPFFVDQSWLWRIRAEQVRRDPDAAVWVARAALVDGTPVGHVGFHGPPDENGMVEVAYSVDPAHRRRGHARTMLRAALVWAAQDPRVRTVRASVSPDNTASLAVLRPFGFTHVGEQWDEEDGRELLYELPVEAARRG